MSAEILCRLGRSLLMAPVSVGILLLSAQGHGQDSLPLEELQIFSEVFGKIKSEYVDDVDDATLLRDAIQGMLDGLDPHSTFLEPEDFEDIKFATDGKFGGLGIEVTTEEGLIKVITPIDGTPAFDAGIKPGDLILKLDGVPVRGMNLKQAVDKMRGEPGSEIRLSIQREGQNESLEITLVRAIIKITSVKGEILEDDFGYIRLSSFQSGTAQSLRSKINILNSTNGASLKGLVLDLRNNPGGVLTGAVEVSDMFISEGEIVSTRGRTQTAGQSFSAKPDDVINGAPLVVLVNGGSASASEIVAGALQDHKRGLLIGTKTFGKGSVQTVIPMNNGGALKLTTARYYTPSDRSIQAKGIVPDIITEQVEYSATQDKRDRVSESDLAGHLQNDALEDDSGEDEAGEDETGGAETGDAARKNKSARIDKDYQLRQALNLLKGMSLVKQSAK